MFIFKKNNLKSKVAIIFDIGSASVGGAIVLLNKNKIAKILYNTRQAMIFEKNLNIDNFIDSMLKTLEVITKDLEKNGLMEKDFLNLNKKEIEDIFCFISSPWNISRTSFVKIKKEEIFSISTDLLNEIVKKEEADFLSSLSKQELKILGGENKNIEILDKKIIQVKLNGYKVDNPFGKKVKETEVAVFSCLVSSAIVGKIKKIINKTFTGEIHINSFALASFFTLRDFFSKESDFIFLDVSGEITDIFFVKDDVLVESFSFPVGKNSFKRELLKNGGGSSETANSCFNLYNRGEMRVEEKIKMDEALGEIKKEWSESLERGLCGLGGGSFLPRSFFILADNDLGPFLEKLIREYKFTKVIFPNFNKAINPILINEHKIAGACFFSKGVEKDIFLGIESFYVNKLFDLS